MKKNNNVSVGLIGCGSIADIGVLPHLQLHGIQVAAVCDTSQDRIDYISAKYNVPKGYTDFEVFLAESGVDAVIIATPIFLHFKQAEACLNAGMHTYIQKTMTETATEAKQLIALAKANNLQLAASPGQILLPAYSAARELLNQNAIGNIYTALTVNWAPGHEYEPTRADTSNPALSPAWYYKKGGGPLRDMGIYALHSLIDLFGPVHEVFAYANRPVSHKQWGEHAIEVETDDNYSVSLTFDNGVIAQMLTGFCSNPALLGWGHMTIVGSAGSIEVRRKPGEGSVYQLYHSDIGGTPKIEEFGAGLDSKHDEIGEAHVGHDIIDFVEAVAANRVPGASAATASHAIEVIEAIESAVGLGMPKKIN